MSACCVLEAASLLSGGAIPPPKQCEEYKKSTYTPWRKSTAIAQFETICCFVTCGWATGDGSCGGFVGPLIDNSLLNKIPVTGQIFNIDGNLGTPGAETVADEFHLDPYDNIYTAVGSMCPVAILTNLRKLSLIYKTYNCCVDQACENGISTDVCEDQLFEATCMYFGGSVLSIIAKILTSILTKYAAQGILFLNTKWLGAWLDCPLSVFQLYNSLVGIYQGTINLVDKILKLDQGSYECEDLGFDKIREESKPVPFQQSPAGKAYEIFTKKQSNFLPRTAELAKIASYEEGEFFIELYGASGKIIVKKFHSLNENNVLTLAKTYYDTDYDGVYDTEVDSEGAWELNIPVE